MVGNRTRRTYGEGYQFDIERRMYLLILNTERAQLH